MNLQQPAMPSEVMVYIRKKLDALAEQNKVRILLAVESGSRAWGFPSRDSDYDVRFIYAHTRNDYLSVQSFRDVIETPLVHDDMLGVPMDMNGWDIRKTLQLAIKSNPVLSEWLTSPVRYISSDVAEELSAFAGRSARLSAFEYHYDRLARNAWEQICENTEAVKLKLYCYALRPVMALRWIREREAVPPMDAISLSLELDVGIVQQLADLLNAKAGAYESDTVPHNAKLDAFIEGTLSTAVARPAEQAQNEMLLQNANALFQKFIC